MNVAPQYTLDAVEALVAHAEVNIRGMLLTLSCRNGNSPRGYPIGSTAFAGGDTT